MRGQAGRVVSVVTHESPDGDAIGSLLATKHLLERCGAEVHLLCPDPAPAQYSFLAGADRIRPALPPGATPALWVLVDCASLERIGPVADQVGPGARTLNIDHHASNTLFATYNWVQPEASSTGEMIAGLFVAMGLPFADSGPALYTAMVTDTGGFAFESTTPRTHLLAASLLEGGVKPGQMQDLIYNTRQPAALRLLGRALSRLELALDDQVAYMTLEPQDFIQARGRQEHTDGIVNYARSVAGARVGLLFYAIEPGLVRIGIRTKPGVDASWLAAQFGGGGHPRAAGCRFEGAVTEAVSAVLAVLEEHLAQR